MNDLETDILIFIWQKTYDGFKPRLDQGNRVRISYKEIMNEFKVPIMDALRTLYKKKLITKYVWNQENRKGYTATRLGQQGASYIYNMRNK